jgi:hypothetical protein
MLPETGEFRKAKFNGAVSAPKPTPGEVHVCRRADRSNPSHPRCCPREIHGICPACEVSARRLGTPDTEVPAGQELNRDSFSEQRFKAGLAGMRPRELGRSNSFLFARYSSTIEDAGQQHFYDCRSFQFVSPPSYCVIRCASWIHQAVVET